MSEIMLDVVELRLQFEPGKRLLQQVLCVFGCAAIL